MSLRILFHDPHDSTGDTLDHREGIRFGDARREGSNVAHCDRLNGFVLIYLCRWLRFLVGVRWGLVELSRLVEINGSE